MSSEFSATPDPSEALCAEVAASAPANPFCTARYLESKRALGFQPWVLTLRRNGQLTAACSAFMQSKFLRRSLEIHSLPALPEGEAFWDGLQRLCRQTHTAYLEINSYASPAAARTSIPSLPGELGRRARCEYVLELQARDLWKPLASNHARNIKRAQNAGLQVRRAADAQACQEHARLIGASMDRRRGRGEAVPEQISADGFAALTRQGAGEIFQAVHNGTPLSSILVLLAERGAYYQSAGSSPEGKACGASHFLVYEVANRLRERAIDLFNLGGAEPHNTGLARFKAGFGTGTVELEAARFFSGSAAQKRILMTAAYLRQNLRLPWSKRPGNDA